MANFAKGGVPNREIIDFNRVTEQGLSKLIRGINSGNKITSTTATNRKLKRQSAIGTELVKRAIFLMDGGQKLEVVINDSGVVYQAKLNSKVIPFDTGYVRLQQVGAELGRIVTRNQTKFDTQLARKAARSTDTSDVRPASRPLGTRLTEAKNHLTNVSSSHVELTETVTQLEASCDDLEQVVSTLERKLEQETQTTGLLEAELATAQRGTD